MPETTEEATALLPSLKASMLVWCAYASVQMWCGVQHVPVCLPHVSMCLCMLVHKCPQQMQSCCMCFARALIELPSPAHPHTRPPCPVHHANVSACTCFCVVYEWISLTLCPLVWMQDQTRFTDEQLSAVLDEIAMYRTYQ